MKTTISLKQLRLNPREYVRLLSSGYEVTITEHRQPIVTAVRPASSKTLRKGNIAKVLDAIKGLPKVEAPYPDMDTTELIKRTRAEGYETRRRDIGQA